MPPHSNIVNLKNHGKATGTFYFKQFKVEDGRSTMKVGTDAVLLGAVVDLTDAANILEIGTGCGVISLILAQRSKASIDAIEIDEESVRQAKENVRDSTWADRITIINSSLQDFVKHTDNKYDIVVSNPPFFSRALKSPDNKRNISRHNDSLTFEELQKSSSLLKLDSGSLWLILPVKEGKEFIETAGKAGLFLHSELQIFPKAGKDCNRAILQFKKTPAEKKQERILVIKTAENSFTEEYIELTKEFYIDF
jgi:tRNA1Val (adenine37-N6)-methyltransferase